MSVGKIIQFTYITLGPILLKLQYLHAMPFKRFRFIN